MTIRAQMFREVLEGTFVVLTTIAVVFALVMLAGCATLSGSPGPQLQRGVYAAESDFAAGLRIAVAYEALPSCGGHPAPCSDPKVEAKIKVAAMAARASLSTAEAAVRSGSNGAALANAALQARADVSAFTALAAELGK